MERKHKKEKFADWNLKDWCIYAGFIFLCFLFTYGSWYFIKIGKYLTGFLFVICFILLFFICMIPIFSKQIPEVEHKFMPLTVSIPKTKEKFLELVKSIGANDEILKEVSQCLDEPKIFLKKIEKTMKESNSSENGDLYEDLSAEYEEYRDDTKGPFIHGGLILLDYRRIVARFDWKTDRETFVFVMKKLSMVNENGLNIDENAFSKFEEVRQFCGRLDELWKKAGYHTVIIDTDSDEYIVGIQKNL